MTTTTISPPLTSTRACVLHVAEMLLVMFIGMGIFSAITALLFVTAGSSLTDQPGWLPLPDGRAAVAHA
jgi:hypothetical protein